VERPIVEVCVGSAEGAIAARAAGADRVELCADLVEGGITPSLATVRIVRERTEAGLMVMIRPRGGDFLYSDLEYEVMQRDVDIMKQAGVDGVVLGILCKDGSIDVARTARLVEHARPLQVTFHRAFDMTPDPEAALEALVTTGADRLLTSGQADDVSEALDVVARLVAQAGDRIRVMPGAGVTEANARDVIERTGAREIHFAALVTRPSGMEFHNPTCTMGAPVAPGEYEVCETDPALVAAILAQLDRR